MGAVADAARRAGAHTFGAIPQSLVDLEVADRNADELVVTEDMLSRKTVMMTKADAFVVLPGGFGTLDELFEALTLVQTKKVTKFPVVLFGRSYWSGLYDWLASNALTSGKINERDLALLHLTDDIDDAVQVVENAYRAWEETH